MERLYLYNGALAVLGLSFLFNSGATIAGGDVDIISILFLLSGGGMVLGAVYESLRTDPAEFTISAGALMVIVGGACLSFVAIVLDIVTTA
ncbi:hypothetical protein AUR64_14695 [Haloprofundus marisrubri]|uniref:Uncharacterized protein n=1 Tax=Haloprofundus marisrubri TaxID=1514971 RepID=A0A0W1R7E4_9EURY|nr:hypothetical protein [Haloprofundus marisrubri]KTG09047.1 hypothetical protein AUR64_14695 [Haloprofundus marisrubri]